jgi:hypothetical protein
MMKRNKPGRHSSKLEPEIGVIEEMDGATPRLEILDEIAPPAPAVKRTIVVVASEDFMLQPVIASVMLEWWLGQGKPQNILLRTHHVRAGHLAADVWSAQDFDFRIETMDEESRYPEGDLAGRLLDPLPEHVFTFTTRWTPFVEVVRDIAVSNGVHSTATAVVQFG